jgi:hypothetical protein
MRTSKRMLLATAAYAIVAMGVTSQQAMAFDDVDWNWNLDVTENIDIGYEGTGTFDPSGLVSVEKIQAHIGDLNAASTVTGVHNNAASGEGGGTVSYTETISLQALFDDNEASNPITNVIVNNPDLEASNASGNVDNNNETVNITFDLTGEVPVVAATDLDAVDLPSVVSTATAVANNQSIESDVALNIHDAQFVFGGFNGENGDSEELDDLSRVLSQAPDTGNTHTDILGGLTMAAALGLITPSSITATSDVSDIINASVDSTATAIGNNLDVEVNASTPGDAFALADVTQFTYADLDATSSVSEVSVNNYDGFGGAGMGSLAEAQIPLVKSAATAVGNNMAIKVSAPSVGTGL